MKIKKIEYEKLFQCKIHSLCASDSFDRIYREKGERKKFKNEFIGFLASQNSHLSVDGNKIKIFLLLLNPFQLIRRLCIYEFTSPTKCLACWFFEHQIVMNSPFFADLHTHNRNNLKVKWLSLALSIRVRARDFFYVWMIIKLIIKHFAKWPLKAPNW